MARYIDADKLIAEYDRVHKGPPGGARKLMVEAPVEDVVKVVRCKDCEHYQKGVCNHFGYYTYAPDVEEDDFCSCGERKSK